MIRRFAGFEARGGFGLAVALLILAVPMTALAEGEHHQGIVSVGTNWAAGAMNDRFNASPSTYKTFISASGYAGSTVSFIARNSAGRSFSCYVVLTCLVSSAQRNLENGRRRCLL